MVNWTNHQGRSQDCARNQSGDGSTAQNLEKALQDPQPSLADSSYLKRPASIRLDKLREEVVLDKLADRIASRLVRLLGGVDISARPLLTGDDVSGVRSGDFTNVKNY